MEKEKKKFIAVTRQCACVKTSTKTFAAYVALEPAPLEHFAELVTGKVKLEINDFSRGKGDLGVRPFYYLELKYLDILRLRAEQTWNEQPFQFSAEPKVWSWCERDRDGKVPAFRMTILRNARDKAGNPMRSPWRISIEDGRAIPVQNEKTGQVYGRDPEYDKTASINLADADFLAWIRSAERFIDNYARLTADSLIPQGEKRIAEQRERGTRGSVQAPPEGYAAGQGQAPAPAQMPARMPAAEAQAPAQAAGAQPPAGQGRFPGDQEQAARPAAARKEGTMDVVITSGFNLIKGYAVCGFSCRGKEYHLYIPDGMFEEAEPALTDSYKNGSVVRLGIVSDGGRLTLSSAGTVA